MSEKRGSVLALPDLRPLYLDALEFTPQQYFNLVFHDFKNNLTPMFGFVDLAIEGAFTDEENSFFLQIAPYVRQVKAIFDFLQDSFSNDDLYQCQSGLKEDTLAFLQGLREEFFVEEDEKRMLPEEYQQQSCLQIMIREIEWYLDFIAVFPETIAIPDGICDKSLVKLNKARQLLEEVPAEIMNFDLLIPNYEPVNIKQKIEEVLFQQRKLNGHSFETNYPKELEDQIVETDGHFLQRILDNLIDNGCKYSAKGSPLTIKMESSCGFLAIVVQDFGMGLPLECLQDPAALFSPGKRFAPEIGGSGYGLCFSQMLANKLGGWITPYSAGEGQGSAFKLFLPL